MANLGRCEWVRLKSQNLQEYESSGEAWLASPSFTVFQGTQKRLNEFLGRLRGAKAQWGIEAFHIQRKDPGEAWNGLHQDGAHRFFWMLNLQVLERHLGKREMLKQGPEASLYPLLSVLLCPPDTRSGGGEFLERLKFGGGATCLDLRVPDLGLSR